MNIEGFTIEGNVELYDFEYLENKPTVDSALSGSSTNAIQNKAVKEALDDKASLTDPYDIYPHDSATGSVVSFTDGADNIPVKDLTIEIKPNQDLHGYSNPWPAGGSKNLFNPDDPEKNGYYNVNGTYSGFTSYSCYKIMCSAETSYTVSGYFAGIKTYWKSDDTFISGENQGSGNSKTFTTPAECAFFRISIIKANLNGTQQIEKSSSVTSYVPYSNICPINGWTGANIYKEDFIIENLLTNFSLTQQGTGDPTPTNIRTIVPGLSFLRDNNTTLNIYSGTFDLASGKITTDLAKITFDGTQTIGLSNWQANDSSVGWLYKPDVTPFINNVVLSASNISTCGLLSDSLKTIKYAQPDGIYDSTIPCISLVGGTDWGIAMRVNDTSLTTNTAINNYLSSHPIDVIYKLVNSVTYQLSASEYERATTALGFDISTVPISWQSTAETVYGGTLDVTTGVLTVTQERVDLGVVNWNIDPNRPGVFYGGISGRKNSSNIIACTQYEAKNINVNTSFDFYISGAISYGSGVIFIRDTHYASSTKEAFKAAMSGVYAVYELATPLTYQLTPTEVKTLLGNNSIWADTGNTTLNYRADTGLYIRKVLTAAATL